MAQPQSFLQVASLSSSHDLFARSPTTAESNSLADAFARSKRPVLLHGETGVGKNVVAEYIHRRSGRADGFHEVSVGGVPSQLVYDELFGHVRGAFTDAREQRVGWIVTAGTGTLLLNDFHTLALDAQKTLFRVLDNGGFTVLGANRVQYAVCRFIVAMTVDPRELVRQGKLYEDLFYRLWACSIKIPALRERREEIPWHAVRALAACCAVEGGDGPTRLSDAAMAVLCRAEYPGNVRELEGVIVRAYLVARELGSDVIDEAHLPCDSAPSLIYRRHGDRRLNQTMVEEALRVTRGNVTKTAQLLGLSRTTVRTVRRRFNNNMPLGRAPLTSSSPRALARCREELPSDGPPA
jgi:DNA-binding NtrC family response regulator